MANDTDAVRNRIDALEKDYNRLRWLSAALVALIAAIFFAGFYFRDAIGTYAELRSDIERANQLRVSLAAAKPDQRGSLSSTTTEAVHDANHIQLGTGVCPPGQYASGIRSWGNKGGGCNGCVNGMMIMCRSFVGP